LLDRLKQFPLIPVITIDRAEDIIPLGEVLEKTDLRVAEITFRTEAAPQAISLLKKAFPEILVGAGTVLSPKEMMLARDCGVDFFVSPGFNPSMVDLAAKLGVLLIPGVTNPGQVEQAMWQGLKTLKFFPAEAAGGVPMLKAFGAVYPMVDFMPTGGINLSNIRDYLALDHVFACGGSWIVPREEVQKGQWASIEKKITEAMTLIKEDQ